MLHTHEKGVHLTIINHPPTNHKKNVREVAKTIFYWDFTSLPGEVKWVTNR